MKTRTEILNAIEKAPYSYRKSFIPKRNGTQREINAPSEETKELQKAFSKILLIKLPVSDYARAFIPRLSNPVKTTCEEHRKFNYTISVDIKNFFPAIKPRDVNNCFQRNGISFNTDQWEMVRKITFRGNGSRGIPMGSVCGPIISNAIMHDFDMNLFHKIQSITNSFCFTRYGDDIIISCNSGKTFPSIIRTLYHQIHHNKSPKFRLNKAKTALFFKGQVRKIHGLFIGTDGRITIGGRKKRKLDIMLCKFSKNQLSIAEQISLQGKLAFAKNIEPYSIQKLLDKYDAGLSEELNKLNITHASSKEYNEAELVKICEFLQNELEIVV